MTDKQLNVLAQKWQKRLRLQDWELTVTFSTGMDDLAGRCTPNPKFMECPIEIRKQMTDKEIELTLIHELLHIRFPHFNGGFDPRFRPERLLGHELEVGIEMVARSLIEAYN